ncbi:Cas9 inhibitor AcrIIA9 family protein [Enterococcus alishanensis]
MKQQGANTVKALLEALEDYPKDCMIALFDELQGFLGIGFKLEPVTIDNCQTKQIVLKQRENNQLYDVQAFIGYLNKFPLEAQILMRNQQGEPSPIYVCVDGEKSSKTKWLVTCTQEDYDRFFNTETDNQKEKALALLKEKDLKSDNPTISMIYQYISEQNNIIIFKHILEKERTITESMQFCMNKASEIKTDNFVMVSDEQGFQWILDYFTLEEVKIKPIQATLQTSKPKKQPSEKPKKAKKEEEQISLFDMA